MARAVVVGAGIGGLTSAAALSQAGWDVTVYEQAPALEEVGAGIGVSPNGLRALDVIGAGDEVRAMAVIQGTGGIRRRDGRWLARTHGDALQRRLGDAVTIALRSDLVDVLARRLPERCLRLGVTVRGVTPGDERTPARVTMDARTEEADLVVAADGVRSPARTALFPAHPGPAYAGCSSWRFVVRRSSTSEPEVGAATRPSCQRRNPRHLPEAGEEAQPGASAPGRTYPSLCLEAGAHVVVPAPDSDHLGETWGGGPVFGVMPLVGDRVYCYATARVPAGERAEDEAAYLAELFAGWHDPIPSVISAARDVEVLRNDVYEMREPLRAFHAGRVALVGDAAHAMVPNLGQGGCQAMEDAVTLAHHARADGADGVPRALAAYSAARVPRANGVVRQARRMQRTAELSWPAVLARDAGMALARLLSADMTARLFFAVADWHPPQTR